MFKLIDVELNLVLKPEDIHAFIEDEDLPLPKITKFVHQYNKDHLTFPDFQSFLGHKIKLKDSSSYRQLPQKCTLLLKSLLKLQIQSLSEIHSLCSNVLPREFFRLVTGTLKKQDPPPYFTVDQMYRFL
jgi:hypothetical protein